MKAGLTFSLHAPFSRVQADSGFEEPPTKCCRKAGGVGAAERHSETCVWPVAEGRPEGVARETRPSAIYGMSFVPD